MRLAVKGEIVPCNYDFDTKRIGHVVVDMPYHYSTAYIEGVSDWSKHDLWKELVTREGALAAVIVNNQLLITIRNGNIVVSYDNGSRAIITDVKKLYHPRIPVGFVRTCPEVKDVNVPPYRLYTDDNGIAALGEIELIKTMNACECTDMSLYRSLIKTDYRAVYMSTGGPVYI